MITFLSESNSEGKPILVKVAPDLSSEELRDVIDLALETELSGIIATNTTLSREGLKSNLDETGGLSGAPLRSLRTKFIQQIWEQAGEELAIVAVGGISTIDDVVSCLISGASLLQIYTGIVYEGPWIVGRLARQLDALLSKLNVKSIPDLRTLSKDEVFAALR